MSVAAVFWTAKLQNVSVKQRAEVQNLARIVCNPAICFLWLSVRQSVAPLLLLLSFFFSIRFPLLKRIYKVTYSAFGECKSE